MKKEDKVVMGMSRKGWRNEGREGNGLGDLIYGRQWLALLPFTLVGPNLLDRSPLPTPGFTFKKKSPMLGT